MSTLNRETEPLVLLRTKFQRPRPPAKRLHPQTSKTFDLFGQGKYNTPNRFGPGKCQRKEDSQLE